MEINISLKTSDRTKKGHPIIFEINNGSQRLRRTIFHSELEHWDDLEKTITPNHPDYSNGITRLINLKQNIKRVDLIFASDAKLVMSQLLPTKKTLPLKEVRSSFIEFSNFYQVEKINFNEEGNAMWYKCATDKLMKFTGSNICFDDFDYNFLNEFVKFCLKPSPGNRPLKKTTVGNYLRAIRAIYNEGCRRWGTSNNKPFEGLPYMNIKPGRNRKKYLSKEDLIKLKNADRNKSLDFFLLSFYLCGMNLIDIYYLKVSELRSGRIFKRRSKTDGYEFDVKVFPEAQKIIDKYACPSGVFVFPFPKERHKYKYFNSNRNKYIKRAQQNLKIAVKPNGGNISMNVARHSFSTIGVQENINSDIKKLLMGHELDDIQSAYEYYSEEMRDEAHRKIITLSQ